VRRLRPQVLHFHSAMPHGEVVAALRLLRSAPLLVVTPHSSRPFAKRRARLGLRVANLVIAPSAWAASHALAAGARHVMVSHAGIDAGAEPDLDRRESVVLALGRLADTKGFDVLLAAFGACAAARPDWQLWIAGEGAARAALETRPALACADRVHSSAGSRETKDRALARAAIGAPLAARVWRALLEMSADSRASRATPARFLSSQRRPRRGVWPATRNFAAALGR
jgi:glycosyltransferase involved in cell wall biosynthesis